MAGADAAAALPWLRPGWSQCCVLQPTAGPPCRADFMGLLFLNNAAVAAQTCAMVVLPRGRTGCGLPPRQRHAEHFFTTALTCCLSPADSFDGISVFTTRMRPTGTGRALTQFAAGGWRVGGANGLLRWRWACVIASVTDAPVVSLGLTPCRRSDFAVFPGCH
jgi:hypothetical protein